MEYNTIFSKIPCGVPQTTKEFITNFLLSVLETNNKDTIKEKIKKIYLYDFTVSGNLQNITEIGLIIIIDETYKNEYNKITDDIDEKEFCIEEKYNYNYLLSITCDIFDNYDTKQSVLLYDKENDC